MTILSDIQTRVNDIRTRGNTVISTLDAFSGAALNLAAFDENNIVSNTTTLSLTGTSSVSISGGTVSMSATGALTISGATVTINGTSWATLVSTVGSHSSSISDHETRIQALEAAANTP